MSSYGSGYGRGKGTKKYTQQKSRVREGDEKVLVPTRLIGRVIGLKGQTLREMERESGAVVIVEDDIVFVRGTAEQRREARLQIEEIVSSAEGETSGPGKWRCLDRIPRDYLRWIIGKRGDNLRRIETETNTRLKATKNIIYITGDEQGRKKAAIKIKEIGAKSRTWKGRREKKIVYVEASGYSEGHEFELKKVSGRTDETRYRLCPLDQDLLDEPRFDIEHGDIEHLKGSVVHLLQMIQSEKSEINPVVDMWCHFGKSCIKEVDEEEEDKVFKLSEIKQKLGTASRAGAHSQGWTWKCNLEVGIEELEVDQLEQSLAKHACSPKYDIRHDFSFYTPTCRDIRVKTWLDMDVESGQNDEGAMSMSFASTPPLPVRNCRYQKLPEGDGPGYYICVPFQNRIRADVILPFCTFDCRLLVRTTNEHNDTSPEDEEEDLILYNYLDKMMIQEGKLVLPPEEDLPDGFDLYFRRRSFRKTYKYETPEKEMFSLTVCKDEPLQMNGMPDNTAGTKMDVHLHCDEWDRVLTEGDWDPAQIISKFPAFIKFVSYVQRNIKPARDEN